MRRVLLALGLSLTLVTPSFAELASPLELVRALRQAGLVDLAVKRLEELKANPALVSPADAQLLPLELARIRLEEAARETEDARRVTLIGQARASFDEFIKQNPTHPMSASARVEMARLTALQAKGQLSRGNRQENKEAKALEYSRARPDFTAAINLYKGAITNLDNRLKNLPEKDPLAAELKRSKAQAELDAAVLRYELAQTFVGEDERKQKGDETDKAQKEFQALATTYANQRVGYLAQVWASQCGFAIGEGEKAVTAIEKFITANRQNREAADAVRLAGFFGIEHAFEESGKDTSPAARYIRTEQVAQRWLQSYPEAKNTPEGLGARYRRALMKEAQAFLPGGVQFEKLPKAAPKVAPKPPAKEPAKAPAKEPAKGKPAEKGKESAKESAKEPEPEKEAPPAPRKIIGITPQAKSLLEEANKIYKELTETDNEYSERAHRHRLINQLVILDGEGKGGDPQLKQINTLEQGYLAAQVQQARIYDLNKDERLSEDQKDKEEKRRTKLAVSYLERGLQKVTPRDPVRDVFDAQMLQVQLLTKDDRAVEAAVLGEGLARNNPKMSKAALAAVLGVYAYNTAIGKARAAGLGEDAEAADLQRLKTLATYTITTWPNDGPTDAARHVLGFFLSNREKKYDEAWKVYSGIGTGYPDVAQARREMAGAMFYLIRPEDKDPKKYREALQKNVTDRAKEFAATVAGLDALPDPSPAAPAPQVESWTGAKTMQAQLYYMAGDYDKVDVTVKKVSDTLKKTATTDMTPGTLDPKRKADLEHTIRALKFNALQGRAADFVRAKEFAKVGESLGAELEALKKELSAPAVEETPGLARLRRAQRDFLIAAMSAYLQNKQADQAGELLDTLQGAGGTVEQNVAVMQQLVASIRGQIDTLTKENKKAEADELARGFSEFLDKIKGGAKLTKNVVVFLGQGYGAVDQHAKAAELFGGLLAEVNPNADQGFHRQLQFMKARAHRQAGQFAEATALMQTIVGDPVKKGAPQGWGYRNLVMRKEYCMLLEDQNFFGPAISNWTQLTREFVPGGLPLPVKFLGARPAFVAAGQSLDELMAAHAMFPTGVAPALANAFQNVFPGVADNRSRLRLVYFDLFYEAQRSSARAYTTPVIVAKLKGGQATADQKLADIGQRFYELLSRNEDVQPEVKEKIKELMDKTPLMKKKFDEMVAAPPAPKS